MASIHDSILEQIEIYKDENEKFDTKGVKASAARARQALGEIGKMCKERRKEIQEKKNEM